MLSNYFVSERFRIGDSLSWVKVRMTETKTKARALREGRSLLQRHGYNGFSFQDIANALEIKKPSLYDHFSSKEALIIAIIEDYGHKFDQWAAEIDGLSADQKIEQVFQVFYRFSCDGKKVCPILALTTDLKVLSMPIKLAMKSFIDRWLAWLTDVIEQGQQRKIFRKDIKAGGFSKFIYSQIMGSQLQARITNNPKLILESAKEIQTLILR